MYELLRQYKKHLLISGIFIFLIAYFTYFVIDTNISKKNETLYVEIYSIKTCISCEQVQEKLPDYLKKEFGNNISITILDIDQEENYIKYENMIKSLDNFNLEFYNMFPVIDVIDYFTIFGYNSGYEEEIVNDIIRKDKSSHLGKVLENYRFERRNYEK